MTRPSAETPAAPHLTSGTGAGLLDFLAWAGSKGNLNPNTAGAMRAAARELLGVEATDGDFSKIEIRTLDVDDLARRFANLRASKYSSGSMETYQGRFRRSVEMYKKFLENPAVWRPGTKERPTEAVRKPSKGAESPLPLGGATVAVMPTNLMVYPFPIRKGVMASLSLPSDLTQAEARRLKAFVEALAVDEPRLLTDGRREVTST